MNKQSQIVTGVIILVAVVVIGFILVSRQRSNVDTSVLGNELMQLAFTDYAGNDVRLSDFAGTPLVVNSWATWCPFCKQELPDFATVQEELGDKVVFIAINRRESLNIAREYTNNAGITDSMVFLLDPEDTFYNSIGAFSMPETLFINANGDIEHHKRGFMTLKQVRNQTNLLLN